MNDDSDSSLESLVEEDPKVIRQKRLRIWKANLGVLWRVILGVVALFDFLSTVLPGMLRVKTEHAEDDHHHRHHHHHETDLLPEYRYEAFGHAIPTEPFGSMIDFLDDHSGHLGFAFSMLCFIEAFLDASRSRHRALMERDRKRLIRSQQKQNLDDSSDHPIDVIDDLAYLDDDHDTRTVFYCKLLLQLMLLPVGFWLACEALFLRGQVVLWGDSMEDGRLNMEELLDDEYDMDSLIGNVSHERDMNLSVGFALLRMLLEMLVDFLNVKGVVAKKKVMRKIVATVRKTVGGAVRHPLQFYRKAQSALTALRWIKYLQPILGNTNKLIGNLKDLAKKYRQRQEFLLMQKVRRKMFREMNTPQRREYAARKIQGLFRGNQARKHIRAVKLLRGNEEAMAALRLQAIFRRKLKEARARIKRRKKELKQLQAKAELDQEKKAENQSLRMNAQERLRLYQLEEEVNKESLRILQRRLLIKPDTRFAVTWRVIFCVCVVCEISMLVCNPLLKKYKDHSGNPLTVQNQVKEFLIPLPVSELKECSCEPHSRIGGWGDKLKHRFLHDEEPPHCDELPWYCLHPYSTARAWYSNALEFLIDEFLLVIGLVMFWDVPISFFTGDYDKDSGSLIPKHWFPRWVLPGLVLQFIVNPHMKATGKLVGRLFGKTFELGPVRVFRWNMGFFYPFFFVLLDLGERYIWIPLVKDQNRQTLLARASSTVMGKHRDLTESIQQLKVSAQKKKN
ncbi:expressed unknown protein [Seminavis robusta]|uniref:Uncharacterized protein n=1 Tax=Seminavis robusta TaxID=568900 RepID=A0A9N8F0H8_9STRA|nr:expressed unknown protein [Seminavis robusta]|eukprot:Sro2601_g332340.1 n/a (735) ;mRNA; r:5981-8185